MPDSQSAVREVTTTVKSHVARRPCDAEIRNTHSQSGHGFSLIELLVVIAIISLLVSILLPSLNKAKDLARQTACASRYRSISTAIAMYTGDSGGTLPPIPWYTNCNKAEFDPPWWDSGKPRWMSHRLAEFLPSGVWQCPATESDDQDSEPDTIASNVLWNGVLFQKSPWPRDGRGGQVANADHAPVALSRVGRPSDIAMAQERYNSTYYAQYCTPWAYSSEEAGGWYHHAWFDLGSYRVHNEGQNLPFADGSVRWHNELDVTSGMFGLNPGDHVQVEGFRYQIDLN